MTWLGSCPFKKISVNLDIDSRADATEAPPYIPGPPGFTSNHTDSLHTPQEPASFFFAWGPSLVPGSMLGPKQVQPRSAGELTPLGTSITNEGRTRVSESMPQSLNLHGSSFEACSPPRFSDGPQQGYAPGTHSENCSLSPALGFLISPQHCPLCSLESPPK